MKTVKKHGGSYVYMIKVPSWREAGAIEEFPRRRCRLEEISEHHYHQSAPPRD